MLNKTHVTGQALSNVTGRPVSPEYREKLRAAIQAARPTPSKKPMKARRKK